MMRSFGLVVALALAISGMAKAQERTITAFIGDSKFVIAPAIDRDVVAGKAAAEGCVRLAKQRKTLDEKLGKFERALVIQVTDQDEDTSYTVTKEEILVKVHYDRMGPLDTAVLLVKARAMELGVKDAREHSPQIMGTAFALVLPDGEYVNAAATLKDAKLFSKERIAELKKADSKLKPDEGDKLANTSLALSRHWTHGKKGALKDFLVADTKDLPEPSDALSWFLKTYKK